MPGRLVLTGKVSLERVKKHEGGVPCLWATWVGSLFGWLPVKLVLAAF